MTNRKNTKTNSGTTLKVVAVIMAMLLVVGCVLVVLQLCAPAGKKVKPSEWFQKPAAESGLSLPETAGDNGVTLTSAAIPVSQYEEYGIMPIAESAQTITATVEPQEAAPFAVITWSAAWKDGGATDIESYLTLDFGEDEISSKTCRVSCLKAFSKQIVITASVVDQPELTATVTADYVRAYQSYEITIKAKTGYGTSNEYEFNMSNQPAFSIVFNFGTGTIFPELENEETHHLYIKLTDSFKNLLDKNLSGSGISYTNKVALYDELASEHGDTLATAYKSEKTSAISYEFYPDKTFASPAEAFLTGASKGNGSHVTKFNSVFAATINEANRASNTNHAMLTTDAACTFSYNGINRGSVTSTQQYITFLSTGLKILADSFDVNQEALYF